MAYDTPYLGVHPGTFKTSATEAWGYVQQAQAVATSLGAGWAFLNGSKGNASVKPQDDGIKRQNHKPPGSSAGTGTGSGKGKQRAANQDETSLSESLRQAGTAAQKSADATNGWTKYAYAAAGVGA